jgi:hypothetical protein
LDLRSPLTINFNLIAANAPELVEHLPAPILKNLLDKNPILCIVSMPEEDQTPGKPNSIFALQIF